MCHYKHLTPFERERILFSQCGKIHHEDCPVAEPEQVYNFTRDLT